MDGFHEDYKKKIIREFNDNIKKSEEVTRLIAVLEKIRKNKENCKMPKTNKLTKEQKEEIRNRTGESTTDLGKEFGVTAATITYHQKKKTKKPKKEIIEKVKETPILEDIVENFEPSKNIEKKIITFTKSLKFEITVDVGIE